jgi:hypothetical protein
MSWLRNHIRHFVVPGLKALAKARIPADGPPRRYGEWGEPLTPNTGVLSTEVTPLNIGLRPSKKCSHKEAGLVYAAVCSFFRDTKFRDDALRILSKCDADLLMPDYRSDVVIKVKEADGKEVIYSKADVIHSIIKNTWRSLKEIAEDRIIILPGRDVWAWEVLARKNNHPTIFDPRISRIYCSNRSVLEQTCKEWDVDFKKALIFDTGFAGSIPRAISSVVGTDVKFLLLSSSNRKGWTQIYPNHKGSRSKVLCIEYFPKYFKTGTVLKGEPTQFLASPLEFVKAAAFTIWLWYYRSPRFIKQFVKMDDAAPQKDALQTYQPPLSIL